MSELQSSTEPFRVDGLDGEVVSRFLPEDLPAALGYCLDAGSASKTLHWGRNYLYVTSWPGADGTGFDIVVKQFRHDSLKARLRRRMRGSKAELSFRTAHRLAELGISTPAPVLFADSLDPVGPSYFACRYLPDLLEARYVLRALAAGTADRDFPDIDTQSLLYTMGRLVRRLHAGDIWHRDMTSGNVLIDPSAFRKGETQSSQECLAALSLVDLNRARLGTEPSLSERVRDLSRMPMEQQADRDRYLAGYFEGDQVAEPVGSTSRRVAENLYALYRRAFLVKNRSKQGIRSAGRRLQDLVLPKRKGHLHIPPASESASSRDKVVWDRLSDQPFQHAGRLEKLKVRLADSGAHARTLRLGAVGLIRCRARYRQLTGQLYREPVQVGGIGVGLAPGSAPASDLLEAIEALGVRHVMLRLRPWDREPPDTEVLARELHAAGVELMFALPQNRELVRDPGRWRAAIVERAEQLLPYGRRFQIGQAINRSKWGVWHPGEYVELFETAAEELRSRDAGVVLGGPSVIDFEPHITAALLDWPTDSLRLDAVSHLLYVDRRGAPENPQMGFDTVGKVVLLRALADRSRHGSAHADDVEHWITEVNWPLREGPHSPAGRDVAVGEEEQASYLVRYYLSVLATGLVDRVYWWQIAAKGYGLIDPIDSGPTDDLAGLRRRPSFDALKQLSRRLGGARSEGPVGTASETQRIYRFRDRRDRTILVGWSLTGPSTAELPGGVIAAESRDGEDLPTSGRRVELGPAPRYFELAND